MHCGTAVIIVCINTVVLLEAYTADCASRTPLECAYAVGFTATAAELAHLCHLHHLYLAHRPPLAWPCQGRCLLEQ